MLTFIIIKEILKLAFLMLIAFAWVYWWQPALKRSMREKTEAELERDLYGSKDKGGDANDVAP